MPESTVSHYELLGKIGSGGMGVVYRARDLKLDRVVALKFLSAAPSMSDADRQRFVGEAKAASALDHPNIGAVFDIDETSDGRTFIAMAYYPGETLKEKIASDASLDDTIRLVIQVVQGLAKAHSRGIIHRDIKPSNIIVTDDGVAKIIDFGLATVSDATLSAVAATRGTPAYMSPEQALGQDVDARTDLWAVGVMLYEIVTGKLPFSASNPTAVLFEVVHTEPTRPRELRADVPPRLERIVLKALAKKREDRYSSAADLARELAAFHADVLAGTPTTAARVAVPAALRSRTAVAVGLTVLVLISGGVYRLASSQREHQRIAADVAGLIRANEFTSAFIRAKAAGRAITDEQWAAMSSMVDIETTPQGAEIRWKDYLSPEAAWQSLGRSPLAKVRVPVGVLRVQVAKDGYETLEAVLVKWNRDLHDDKVEPEMGIYGDRIQFELGKRGERPSGMVRVPTGEFAIASTGFRHFPMDAYFIDKYEVTNRQYKEFVDKGGYHERAYWKQRFAQDGRELTWENAMQLFRDGTGRPGPATWEGGAYPIGQDNYPVGGVSWYEAAAFAEFAGKSLPTLYDWEKPALAWLAPMIVPLSNFGGTGPVAVGKLPGLGPFGTYDMAGNVKEWCWNEGRDGTRYILGGAWDDERFAFGEFDRRPPLDRSATNGFRCVRHSQPPPDHFTAPQIQQTRDYATEKPVSDEIFDIYRAMYFYEQTGLNPQVESVDATPAAWRKEKVTFRAAYGSERMAAYLFLPKSTPPPYETVIFFPWASASQPTSSANLVCLEWLDFVVKSGRAVMYPVYQGTYERRIAAATSEIAQRDLTIMRVKDLARSIDYLETRPDIRVDRIGFYGASLGAMLGPFLALESRIKAAVLADGAFPSWRGRPEADPINFAPRVKIPVLMINGRYDFVLPIDRVQKPMFDWFGTPEKDKRHVLLNTTHYAMVARNDVVREVLGWFDKYLGPVQ